MENPSMANDKLKRVDPPGLQPSVGIFGNLGCVPGSRDTDRQALRLIQAFFKITDPLQRAELLKHAEGLAQSALGPSGL